MSTFVQARALLAIVAVTVVSSVAAAAEIKINPLPSPAIREFDLATIERLGRQIYEQDQFAWKASDIMIAKRTQAVAEKDGVVGWITVTRGTTNLVRFIRSPSGTPEVLYDVAFEPGKEGVFSIPDDKKLTAAEIAQFNARALALKSAANACSENYNTVALKDPAGDGWLVWALAATTDNDAVIIGGHFRLTISPDGKTIRTRDALSKSCLRLRKGTPAAGEERVGTFFSHLVSLTPLETHVFANLQYEIAIFVGTPDGRSWKIDKGTLSQTDMDMPGIDGSSARLLSGQDEECYFLAKKTEGVSKEVETVGGFKVISATESGKEFKPETPPGYKPSAMLCHRRDIIPAPNDWKAIFYATLPLYIVDNGAGHPNYRGGLFFEGGKFRFELLDGALTPDLQERLGKRLDAMQQASQKKR